jgi:hypothetical protein
MHFVSNLSDLSSKPAPIRASWQAELGETPGNGYWSKHRIRQLGQRTAARMEASVNYRANLVGGVQFPASVDQQLILNAK